MSAMVASPFASQSLKHLVVMLNSYPTLRKTKVHLRHILLQHIDILEVSMTTHGSSFLQFLLLDSYHFDDSDHEVKPPAATDADSWTIQQSSDWATHGGSTEFQLLDTAMTVEESKFGTLARNQAASHLLEVILQVAPESSYSRLLETRFKSKMLEFIRHPVANFVVQKLIKSTRSIDQLNAIYNEIKPNLAEFYAGRSGVIMSLTQASLRFPSAQPMILNDIIASIASFSGTDAEELKKSGFAKTILGLSNTPKHVFKKKKVLERSKQRTSATEEGEEVKEKEEQNYEVIEFSPIGSQLLSILFKFDSKVVDFVLNDFISMNLRNLLDMALNRVASRTFESFLMSPAVAHNVKQAFAEKFAKSEGFVAKLAMDKSGSHVLDQLFVSSSVETKAIIAEAVLSVEKALSSIHHGKFVLTNLRIAEFRRNKESWMKSESSKMVRKKAFDEILSFASDAAQQAGQPKELSNNKKRQLSRNESNHKKHDKNGSHDSKKHGKPSSHHDKKNSKYSSKHSPAKAPIDKAARHPYAAESSSSAPSSSSKMEGIASSSSKKRKRDDKPAAADDIDDIFSGFGDSSNKKSKSSEKNGSDSNKKKSAPASAAKAPVPEEAPLSKLKQKKLAKAQKAAERSSAPAS